MPTKSHIKGRFFEAMARLVLRLKGAKILAKNKKTAGIEADILALHKSTLLVVEVKYRQSREKGHQALHPQQRARLQKQAYELANRHQNIDAVRLDVVLFFPHAPFIEYIKDAL